MKKFNIYAVITAALIFSIGTASAEALRLIVKEKQAFNIESSARTGQAKSVSVAYKSISVPSEGDSNAVIDEIRASGQYESVELDVIVSSPKPVKISPSHYRVKASSLGDGTDPNDTKFEDQYYWQAPSGDQLGRANIIGAYKIANNSGTKVTVGVIDSSFGPHEDITYKEGYSFTTAFDEVRKPEYFANEPLQDCGYGHGLSIVSIIGAKTNNSMGIAGIADVDIVAARAMKCGVGYLSDVATSLEWQSGKSIDGVPDISKKVDVVNISLGGSINTCPSYMQEAIDFATSQGTIVLVTANNDYGDVANTTPANCNNVIVVGAVDQKGQKADFSNRGEEVDLVSPGVNIIAAGADNDYVWWDGTSQALPIATGVVILAKSEFPLLNQSEAEVLLTGSVSGYSTNPDGAENDCANNGCGAGILDAEAFLKATRSYMGGETSFIKHSLANGGSCGDELYMDFFGSALSLCDMYEITFNSQAGKSTGISYELYQLNIGAAFDIINATKILESNEPSIISGEVNIKDSSYGFRVCTNGTCGDLLRMNTSDATKPDNCP